MIDRSEQKRAEAERRDSEQHLELLLDVVDDCAMIMLNAEGCITSWNSDAERMYGFPAEEAFGQHLRLLYPGHDLEAAEKHLKIAARQGRVADRGWRVCKDRRQFLAHTVLAAVREEDHTLQGFICVTRDITVTAYTKEVLRANEERTRLIIESMHDALISTDGSGCITDWNGQAQRLFGWDRSQVLNTPMARLFFSSQGLDGARKAVAYDPVNDGMPLNRPFELLGRHRDGHLFPVEAIMTCIPMGEAKIYSLFLRDITERKQAEQLLQAVPGEILRAQEGERKRVARELHDSVNQLLSSVKLRMMSLSLPAASKSAGSPAARVNQRSLAQIQQLLEKCIEEVRRIAQNLMPSELEDLGLVPAVRSFCREFQNRTKIKLKLDYSGIPTSLPNETKLPLFRIIQEALGNVEKHAEAASATVSLRRREALIEAIIQDTGKGFAAGENRRSLDPGGDRHGPRKAKRAGTGLVNMRERATSAGGKFQVCSTPGKGTSVKVQIPFQRPAPEQQLPGATASCQPLA
jgi:PAS domain S-box-containing protein